ncbi:MAG: protein kinase [Betaproteobacteria bacterium]|nr:protein kinase [Betaproteobacteria bacterium]
MEQKNFGRYVIVAELGRGAMGAVFRAIDPLIQRDVAIKTLLPNLPPEIMAEVRPRFLREARSAGRLNHPNIVTIYDVGEQDGVAYIAMELLEGRSLQQILREPAPLPAARIADLVAQVADGLDLAQRSGITHRDIKPANIMVSADWHAKLTDFGVARVAESSMTQTGSALGSPKYMAPEQVTGQKVDPRSDIFSLGVVLYEMLTRRTPFERAGDNTVFAVMNRIAVEPHEPVTRIDPKISAAFDRILDRALAKSPAARYQRAAEMASELRNLGKVAPGEPPARAPAPSPAGNAAAEPVAERLITDLEDFSRKFEREQQARLRAEEAERLRKEGELRRWGEEQERHRQEFERTREAKAGGGAAAKRRTAALDLLKQKVADRAAEDTRAKTSVTAELVDARLHAAFRYLSEFTKMLNEAHPVSEGKQSVMFFGELAGMILGDGFTDLRSRDLHGVARADYVTFKYKVSFARPTGLDVSAQQLQRLEERLLAMGIKYEFSARKNDFGQLTNATLMLTGPFPCQAVFRGEYDQAGIVVELINVRHNGQITLRMKPEELTDDVLDEFGTWVLGADEAFERFLRRR